MRVAIVDDNERDIAALRRLLDRVRETGEYDFTVDSFTDSIAFTETYDGRYDILFLDVVMPHLDGMELARRLRRMGSLCSIVFVTSSLRYAPQGYEVDATAYLLKPVGYLALLQAFRRAAERALSDMGGVNIVIGSKKEQRVLHSRRILFLEVEDHKLLFHMTDGATFAVRDSLSRMEKGLAEAGFCCCNSCYLVNLREVDRIADGIVYVGGFELPMSRHRKKQFTERFQSFIR